MPAPNGTSFGSAPLKKSSKPEVNVLKTKRGPRLIMFEEKSSDAEKQLAEACLPEVETNNP
jgi:hypothetical protein